MARVPRFGGAGDDIDRTRKHEELIRQLRSQKRCHAESKTFLIPGSITSGMYTPPFWVAINPADASEDRANPEYKRIYAFRGVMAVGTVTVQWLVNGTQVGDDHVVTNVANEFEVLIDVADWPAAELGDGDIVQPSFSDASVDASDFSGAVVMMCSGA